MLPHQQQHGDVVGVTAGDGGEAVGSPRPGSRHRHAYRAGGAGVSVGNLHAQPLVPRRKGTDSRRTAQRPPQRGQAAAGKSGYVTYSFLLEGFDHGFGATHNGSSPFLLINKAGWSGYARRPDAGRCPLPLCGMIGQRDKAVNRAAD